MSLLTTLRRWVRGDEPTLVDFESSQQLAGAAGPGITSDSLRQPGTSYPDAAGTYKIQQSYDSLLTTVRELREALDGQTRRQEELLGRSGTLPAAAETLPQTSKIQADMLAMINDRLKMHAAQQKKVSEMSMGTGLKKDISESLQAIKEQMEASNEIDRQLVDSFNRFSMMIDRLHLTNNHAVECLQQVRDSYATSSMQMQEWIERSRHRNGWLLGGAFLMALASFIAVVILLYILFSTNPQTSNVLPSSTVHEQIK